MIGCTGFSDRPAPPPTPWSLRSPSAFKVPAALISGSVAQLNDALEEILDVVASTAVVFGLRFKRERLANVVVIKPWSQPDVSPWLSPCADCSYLSRPT